MSALAIKRSLRNADPFAEVEPIYVFTLSAPLLSDVVVDYSLNGSKPVSSVLRGTLAGRGDAVLSRQPLPSV
jgi:hypothetical protein